MPEHNQTQDHQEYSLVHVATALVVILTLTFLTVLFNNTYAAKSNALKMNDQYLEECNPWKPAVVKDVKNGFLVFCVTDLVEKTKSCKSIDSLKFIKIYKTENYCLK